MIEKITITKAYLAWIITGIATWIIMWSTGDLIDLMGLAVDFSGSVTPDVPREQMVLGFIIISLAYWLLSIVIMGLLVLLTNKQKKIGKYLLTIFCAFQIAYESYASYSIWTTYDFEFGIYDYLLSIISIIFLLCILVKPYINKQYAS